MIPGVRIKGRWNPASWLGYFMAVKAGHILILFIVFMATSMLLSRRIMNSEMEATTGRLLGFSVGASRNLESRFDDLRDDFRLLASLGAFEPYLSEEARDYRDLAMVRRFFARHQEEVVAITLHLRSGDSVTIQILPGNYLSTTRGHDAVPGVKPEKPSEVTHDGDILTISEFMPPGGESSIDRACLLVDHNLFFKSELVSYMMGKSDIWVWSLDPDTSPELVRDPRLRADRSFRVAGGALDAIQVDLEQGLEGIHEHGIFTPEEHTVVSVFSPLMLGGEPMGLVFSIDRDAHLKSLNRLSAFLLLIFTGTILLLASWFVIFYRRSRDSEQSAIRARKRAESADLAKSGFLAAMSHEIRTPLNGVLGYAKLLKDSGLGPEQQNYVEVIRKSGVHLLSVLNDILDFSRIEAGALEIRAEEYSLVGLTEEVVETLSKVAEDKGLELKFVLRGTVPERIAGDAGRLRQVLFNLVGNAIKFSESGSINVFLAAQDMVGFWRIEFQISDSGIGIEQEMLGSLFNPFSQVDSSSSRFYEGTGLGLAICKRLVEGMGGGISVDSTPGLGSDFTFWFHGGKVVEDTPEIQLLAGKSVLLASGRETLGGDFAGSIARLGADVTVVPNEADAVEVISGTEPYDLVLVDCHELETADKDGDTALARMAGALVPVIALVREGCEVPAGDSGYALVWRLPVTRRVLERDIPALFVGRGRPGGGEVGHLKVLIVEDNQTNSELMLAFLKGFGCDALVAADGYKGVELVKMRRFDLVFMDIEMPGLDGMDATRIIRGLESSEGLHRSRIVGLSAHAFVDAREKALLAGMDDYLTKPVDFIELDRVINEVAKAVSSGLVRMGF